MKNWRAALSAIAGIVAVIVISAFGTTSAGTRPYDPAVMASWLQAVGSVAAILGAYLIGERQTAAQRFQATLARKHRIAAYKAVVDVAVQRAHELETFVSQSGVPRDALERLAGRRLLSNAADGLRAIPLHEWEAPAAIAAASALTTQLDSLQEQFLGALDSIALTSAERLYPETPQANPQRDRAITVIKNSVRIISETAQSLRDAASTFDH